MWCATSFASALVVLAFATPAFAAPKCPPPSTSKAAQRSRSFLANTPCAPVASACVSSGYYLGCHLPNRPLGLDQDCLGALFKGKTVPGVPLPPSDPSVAACRKYCNSTAHLGTPSPGGPNR